MIWRVSASKAKSYHKMKAKKFHSPNFLVLILNLMNDVKSWLGKYWVRGIEWNLPRSSEWLVRRKLTLCGQGWSRRILLFVHLRLDFSWRIPQLLKDPHLLHIFSSVGEFFRFSVPCAVRMRNSDQHTIMFFIFSIFPLSFSPSVFQLCQRSRSSMESYVLVLFFYALANAEVETRVSFSTRLAPLPDPSWACGSFLRISFWF